METSRAILRTNGEHWQLKPESGLGDSKTGTRIVPALENAIAIITFLNARAPEPASLAIIASALGISRGHCFALLKTLTMQDWLQFDEATKSYRLQSGLLRDASSLLNQSVAMSSVHQTLTRMAATIQIPSVLSQPVADDCFIVIAKFSAPSVLEVSLPVGHRIPRNACAEMRAFLAWQPEERINRWFEKWEPVRFTAGTLMEQRAIRAEIAATRVRGYARSMGEFTEGLAALALPIQNREGVPFLILNCCAPLPIMLKRETQVARELIRAVHTIHHLIGGAIPRDFPKADQFHYET